MQKYSRYQYLSIINKSLQLQQNDFAGEIALYWLSNFPGDLYISMLYAKSLFNNGKLNLATPILEGLCIADPEFVEAIQLLLKCRQNINKYNKATLGAAPKLLETFPYNSLPSWYYSLIGPRMFGDVGLSKSAIPDDIENWGQILRHARKAINKDDQSETEKLILITLGSDPRTPIVHTTHLKYLERLSDIPDQGKISIAEHYLRLWPNCLTIKLFLAHWLTNSHNSDQGVELIHQVIARDIGGQIPKRVWNNTANPYHELWQADLKIILPYEIPQQIAAQLDWFQLPTKLTYTSNNRTTSVRTKPNLPDFLVTSKTNRHIHQSITQANAKEFVNKKKGIRDSREDKLIKSFNEELEKIAKGIKLSGITNFDGRFPIYIILSSRKNLSRKYGVKNAELFIDSMKAIVNSFNNGSISINGKLWGGRIFIPDDDFLMMSLDLETVSECSPWKLKLAIKDLDEYLATRGEMIGAILIVGGDEIIPFHHLPNPIDDPDEYVASDNPYATRDENYFVPEWPVGRLPDGRGTDPNLLIKSLQRIHNHYAIKTRPSNFTKAWKEKILRLPKPHKWGNNRSFGYSAKIWEKASELVYQPIGKAKEIYTSPPIGASNARSTIDVLPLKNAKLGYFNLHGLIDSADWYGQSDLLAETSGQDYPVALSPTNIGQNGHHKPKFKLGVNYQNNRSSVPGIIFSEACYGAHIYKKSIEEAISLKFLSSGTEAFVGSTSMSYGSLYKPLIAADLLGNAFWHYIEMGYVVGEALRLSKYYLTQEMTSRQGYLDGEDQKTIISFILFGDPLFMDIRNFKQMKGSTRIKNQDQEIVTICDRLTNNDCGSPINIEESEYIKKIVAQYLPGMINAELSYSKERAVCRADDHSCPTRQLNEHQSPKNKPARKVVTLKKSIYSSHHDHSQFARLTLNEKGKLVKLVVSR